MKWYRRRSHRPRAQERQGRRSTPKGDTNPGKVATSHHRHQREWNRQFHQSHASLEQCTCQSHCILSRLLAPQSMSNIPWSNNRSVTAAPYRYLDGAHRLAACGCASISTGAEQSVCGEILPKSSVRGSQPKLGERNGNGNLGTGTGTGQLGNASHTKGTERERNGNGMGTNCLRLHN